MKETPGVARGRNAPPGLPRATPGRNIQQARAEDFGSKRLDAKCLNNAFS